MAPLYEVSICQVSLKPFSNSPPFDLYCKSTVPYWKFLSSLCYTKQYAVRNPIYLSGE